MTLIASENHYQKKLWEMSSIEAEVNAEFARMSPEELAAEEVEHRKGLEKVHRDFEKKAERMVIIPSPWHRWKFKHATKAALAVAEYFQLNVRVEEDEWHGVITLIGDDIMTDAKIWHDNKEKRQLLRILHLADDVCITTKSEYGLHLISIYLSYSLYSKFLKPER